MIDKELMKDVHLTALAKGWWDDDRHAHIAAKAERIHSEITELVNTYADRSFLEADAKVPKYSKAEVEWADCLLRLLDLGEKYCYDLDAVRAKHEYNKTRPYKHGGKAF